MPPPPDRFNSRSTIRTPMGDKVICRLDALGSLGDIDRLPLTIKVLLESCLRNCDGMVVTRPKSPASRSSSRRHDNDAILGAEAPL